MYKLKTIDASGLPFLTFFKTKKILKINKTIIDDSVNFIGSQIRVITDAPSRSMLVVLNEDSKITIHDNVLQLKHDVTNIILRASKN